MATDYELGDGQLNGPDRAASSNNQACRGKVSAPVGARICAVGTAASDRASSHFRRGALQDAGRSLRARRRAHGSAQGRVHPVFHDRGGMATSGNEQQASLLNRHVSAYSEGCEKLPRWRVQATEPTQIHANRNFVLALPLEPVLNSEPVAMVILPGTFDAGVKHTKSRWSTQTCRMAVQPGSADTGVDPGRVHESSDRRTA